MKLQCIFHKVNGPKGAFPKTKRSVFIVNTIPWGPMAPVPSVPTPLTEEFDLFLSRVV